MERDNLLKKITSPNGGIFTGAGTNSYLIGEKDITLVDPGPNIPSHLDKLVEIADSNIKRILVTHTHMDHSPGAKPLAERLSIPCYGKLVENDFSIQDESFKPDFILSEDEHIKTEEYTIKPIHTPGHASNHYCFLIDEIKCLLSGDHIMDGSTVVIGPPDGNMDDYLNSLKRLLTLKVDYFAPGHGNFMHEPKKTIQSIIRHRLARESKTIRKLEDFGKNTIDELVKYVYDDVPEQLHPIAKFSLEAHLIKLIGENKVKREEEFYKLN